MFLFAVLASKSNQVCGMISRNITYKEKGSIVHLCRAIVCGLLTSNVVFQFAELSRQERSLTGRSGALQTERFDLRLAAPLPFEND